MEFAFALVATGFSARPLRVRAALLGSASVAAVLSRFALGGRSDGSLSMTIAVFLAAVTSPPDTRFLDRVVTMADWPAGWLLRWVLLCFDSKSCRVVSNRVVSFIVLLCFALRCIVFYCVLLC